MVNNDKARIGINDIANYMKKHPQAEQIERLSNKEVKETIEILFDTIKDLLKDGKGVEFKGYYTFGTRVVEAQKAKTATAFGKEIKVNAIPEHLQVKVKVSPKLSKEIKEETAKKIKEATSK